MFPSANSTIIRNEDGEVLGWDTHQHDEPEFDDFVEQDPIEDFDSVEKCQAAGRHALDGDGVGEDEAGNTIFQCLWCPGTYTLD